MKQINLASHVLEDPIVLEAIKVVEKNKEEKEVKGHIAGGMGVQSYIPEEFHRKTIDLDCTFLWQGNATDFKELTIPLKRFLEAEGYEVKFGKKHSTFEYTIKKGGDSFLIQCKRESKNHFDIIRKSLEREVANQRRISKKGITYDVLSPEDLSVHKLNRIEIFTDKYGIKKPCYTSIQRLWDNLKSTRYGLIKNFDNISPENIAELRLLCDLFDVACLGNYTGFNKEYFSEVIKEWSNESQTKSDNIYRTLDYLEVPLK